jgi:periplasmic protein TonB
MRFKFGLVTAVLTVVALAAAAAAQEKPGEGETVKPRLKHEVKAEYTPEAKAAGIQGTVMLDTEVLADGTVGDVKITRSLDTKYGLDEQAVNAVKQWTFEPGTKGGKPVPVRVEIEMTFTLK